MVLTEFTKVSAGYNTGPSSVTLKDRNVHVQENIEVLQDARVVHRAITNYFPEYSSDLGRYAPSPLPLPPSPPFWPSIHQLVLSYQHFPFMMRLILVCAGQILSVQSSVL